MHRKVAIQTIMAVIGGLSIVALAVPATQPVSDANAQPASAQAATAQAATAQPANPQSFNPQLRSVAPQPSGTGDDSPGHLRPGLRGMPALSEEEVAAAMVFMHENSPKRYSAIEALPDNQHKVRIKNVAVLAAIQLMRLEKDEPNLYRLSLNRVHLEDDVYGLLADLHKAPADKQEAIKTVLKGKVLDLVNAGILEREARLQKLQETVEAEQKKLADDKANKDRVVDERYAAILREGGGLGASFKSTGPGGNGVPGQRRGEKRVPSDGPTQ
jgi:hypothetical protein